MSTYLEQTGAEVQEILNRPEIKRNSQLINDEGYINREEDPTVPSWSKQPNKPTYTAEEVGAMPSDAAFKTINGESVKGSGNINTDAIDIQNSPRLVATGDVFDEYFGVSAVDLLERGICGYYDAQESFYFIYYKVSGTFPLEDTGIGPTVVFDDGTTRSTITTRDEDGTIYVESLSEESSKVELQQSLTPGSSTKAPSVNAVKNRIEPIEAKIPAEASSSNKLADKAYVDGKVAVVDEKVGDIEDLIPDQASPLNKLADKAFVNSSVQTATANFRGTYNELSDVPISWQQYPVDYAGNRKPHTNDYMVIANVASALSWQAGQSYEEWEYVVDPDYADYVYKCIKSVDGSTVEPYQDTEHWKKWFYQLDELGSGITGTWRFKYTGNWDTDGILGWQPEYQVNEEPFTMAQLAAINSGATAEKIARYDGYAQGKQDKLIDELNIKSVNGQAIMGSGTLPLLNQSLNEIEITNVESGVIYQAFVGGPSLICAELGLDDSVSFSVFNPSNYPCELDLYASEDAPEASVILNMEPFEWMEINGSNVEGSIDWDVVYRSSVTKEVFVATYGVTTAAEVSDAVAAGKEVMARRIVSGNMMFARLQSQDATTYRFYYNTGSVQILVLALNKSTNVWTSDVIAVQGTASRVSSIIGHESSTSHYPNTKAVADYVEAKKEVFWAEYGTTTATEIEAASNAGKVVLCDYSGKIYMANAKDSNYIYLGWGLGVRAWCIKVDRSTNEWNLYASYTLQSAGDRVVTTPSASDLASTSRFPSMKIMADYVEDKLGDIETLLAAI